MSANSYYLKLIKGTYGAYAIKKLQNKPMPPFWYVQYS